MLFFSLNSVHFGTTSACCCFQSNPCYFQEILIIDAAVYDGGFSPPSEILVSNFETASFQCVFRCRCCCYFFFLFVQFTYSILHRSIDSVLSDGLSFSLQSKTSALYSATDIELVNANVQIEQCHKFTEKKNHNLTVNKTLIMPYFSPSHITAHPNNLFYVQFQELQQITAGTISLIRHNIRDY